MSEDDFTLSEAQVAIVGLGLMGGSLAAALCTRRACRKVVGIARREITVRRARDLRFVDVGTTDLAYGVREADVVILATPVHDIIAKIETIGPLLKPGCLLMDVGSTKQTVCRAMETLPLHVDPLGGHPMCGKESSGLSMAEPNLYIDKTFALTPIARTTPRALALGQELVQAIGARALVVDAESHDRAVAAISHLPYIMAAALVNAAEALAQQEPRPLGQPALMWQLASSGFRDTTRVAAGDLTMMMDILVSNQEPVLEAIRQAEAALGKLRNCLENNDLSTLHSTLESARERRLEVYR